MGKLRALKGNLRIWSREVFGDVKMRKKEILVRVEIDALELEGLLDSALRGVRDVFKGEFTDLI